MIKWCKKYPQMEMHFFGRKNMSRFIFNFAKMGVTKNLSLPAFLDCNFETLTLFFTREHKWLRNSWDPKVLMQTDKLDRHSDSRSPPAADCEQTWQCWQPTYLPVLAYGILGKGALFVEPTRDDCLTRLMGSSAQAGTGVADCQALTWPELAYNRIIMYFSRNW